jgi:hypothetical protein
MLAGAEARAGAAPAQDAAGLQGQEQQERLAGRKAAKRARRELEAAAGAAPGSGAGAAVQERLGAAPALPFTADPLDHCESEARCHEDIVPLLRELAERLGVAPASSLRLYDPFFCDGAAARNLSRLGFPRAYNRCEDFYDVASRGACPPHDVLVTNPPYSGDHIERILRFCLGGATPFALLVPNWVEKRDFWEPLVAAAHPRDGAGATRRLFVLTPVARYSYKFPAWVPASDRPEHVNEDGATSPFLSSWFVGVGDACPGVGPDGRLRLSDLFDAMDAQSRAQRRPWIAAHTARSAKFKLRNHAAALAGRGGGCGGGRGRGLGGRGGRGGASARGRHGQGPARGGGAAAARPRGGGGR